MEFRSHMIDLRIVTVTKLPSLLGFSVERARKY